MSHSRSCPGAPTVVNPNYRITVAGDDSNGSEQETLMQKCEGCGNEYDKSFQVVMGGKAHVFDSFECAIHALAPSCEHCGVKIVGHGLEKDDRMFCCDHCAEGEGVSGLRDRV